MKTPALSQIVWRFEKIQQVLNSKLLVFLIRLGWKVSVKLPALGEEQGLTQTIPPPSPWGLHHHPELLLTWQRLCWDKKMNTGINIMHYGLWKLCEISGDICLTNAANTSCPSTLSSMSTWAAQHAWCTSDACQLIRSEKEWKEGKQQHVLFQDGGKKQKTSICFKC